MNETPPKDPDSNRMSNAQTASDNYKPNPKYSFRSHRQPNLLSRRKQLMEKFRATKQRFVSKIPINLRFYRFNTSTSLMIALVFCAYGSTYLLSKVYLNVRRIHVRIVISIIQMATDCLTELLKYQMHCQEKQKEPLVIGYWHMRFKAQVARLLCEHFCVPYVNKIYEHPSEWFRQKNSETFKEWIFVDLPYLTDKDVTLTEMIPIVSYIAQAYGPDEFMGRTIEDKTKVDMFLWSLDVMMKKLVRISCPNISAEDAEREKIQLWNLHVKQKLKFMETYDRMGDWFMGYLTICDFFIYEMVSYFELFFPNSTSKCQNLCKIAHNIGNLDKIKAYETSDRVIKCRLPKEAWDRHVKPKLLEKVQQKAPHS